MAFFNRRAAASNARVQEALDVAEDALRVAQNNPTPQNLRRAEQTNQQMNRVCNDEGVSE